MPPGLMVLWGLVTPEEMAEVIFRALHLLFQQMVIKNLLASWPHSQTVNQAQQGPEPAEAQPHGACIPGLRPNQLPARPPGSPELSTE